MAYVSIDGLDWQITKETEQRTQKVVRQTAFRSATLKAQDYASAYSESSADIGSDKLFCKEAEDFADRQDGGSGAGVIRPMMASMRYGGGGGGPEREAIDLKPQQIAVTAGVTCVFEYYR